MSFLLHPFLFDKRVLHRSPDLYEGKREREKQEMSLCNFNYTLVRLEIKLPEIDLEEASKPKNDKRLLIQEHQSWNFLGNALDRHPSKYLL